MKDIKRILHVVSSMNRGGAESMIMNLYRNIDRNKVQFDFIVHTEDRGSFDDEIENLGGRIFRCKSLGTLGPIKYINTIYDTIKNNQNFHAIHIHTDFQGGFVALAAKKAGIKKRICHSHNTRWKANYNLVDKIQLYIFRKLISRYATHYCACGIDASNFLFKTPDNVKIINNAIEVEKFNKYYDLDDIRKELNIDNDDFIIGHIGRFYEQKNHKHIIDIVKKISELDDKFKVLLVGEGPLLEDVKLYARQLNVEKYINFLGVRTDIPKLMKLFDVFLFPSFFEGLPVVLVEAQSSGLPCVISDTITKEIDFSLGLIEYCNLDGNIDDWIDKINMFKNKVKIDSSFIKNRIQEKGYDIKFNIDEIMKMYGI